MQPTRLTRMKLITVLCEHGCFAYDKSAMMKKLRVKITPEVYRDLTKDGMLSRLYDYVECARDSKRNLLRESNRHLALNTYYHLPIDFMAYYVATKLYREFFMNSFHERLDEGLEEMKYIAEMTSCECDEEILIYEFEVFMHEFAYKHEGRVRNNLILFGIYGKAFWKEVWR